MSEVQPPVMEKKGKPKKLPLPVKLVVGAVAGGEFTTKILLLILIEVFYQWLEHHVFTRLI